MFWLSLSIYLNAILMAYSGTETIILLTCHMAVQAFGWIIRVIAIVFTGLILSSLSCNAYPCDICSD
jgi:hypothetical protein